MSLAKFLLNGCVIAVAAAVMPLALAAEDDNVLLEYSLAELSNLRVETATKSVEDLEKISATVYVITEQDIRTYGYRNLADILENVPGMETINLGFYLQGGQRGLPGNFSQTLLLINGREVSALATQEALIGDQFGVDNIRQVEIMNSPASALYGANAYSGVINILTKDVGTQFQGQRMRFEHGSQDSQGVSLLSNLYGDNRQLSVYFRQYRSNNWDFGSFVQDRQHFSTDFPVPAQDAAAAAGAEYLNKSDSRTWSVRLEADGFYIGTDGYYIVTGKGLETVALDYNSQRDVRDSDLWYAGWKGQWHDMDIVAEYQQLRNRLWGLNYEFRYDVWQTLLDDGRDPAAPITTDEIYNDFQYVYSQENSSGSVRHRGYVQAQKQFANGAEFTVGLVNEYSDLLGEALTHDDLSPPFDETVADDNPMHRPIFRSHKQSVYLQWQDQYWRDKLDVTLGVRVDDQSQYGVVHNFRGGVVYHLSDRTHWRLHYGEAFREPNIFELGTYNPPGSPASDDLEPALIKTIELGWVSYLTTNQRLQVTLFKNDVSDAILPEATAVFANSNRDTSGVESLYDLRVGRWRVDVGYTWLRSDDITIAGESADTVNVYPQRLSLGTAFIPAEHWRISARVQYFSRLDAESGNPEVDTLVHVPSATRVDANLLYTTTFFHVDDTDIGLHIHNLLDRDFYQPNVRNTGPNLFQQPGRQALLSISILY